jgi:DNA repair exonuclease SbcCD nuclease subunit
LEGVLAFRFVHAADIHLDSPLKSLALRNSELADLIGNATRKAFVSIVDLCLDEQVDALLLAGDLYDGDQTSMKTARFIVEQLRRLDEAGIRVFIIRGNHDALSKITKELIPPVSVKIFLGRAEAVEIPQQPGARPIWIHGMSFAQPHAPESLLPRYKPPVEGAVNIGLLHTSLDGAIGHDPYAPCSSADLQASGFRYWALGHIHKTSISQASATVVMPGIPQGRDIGEAGQKGVMLVTVTDDGDIFVEERPTSIAQFERVTVDLTGMSEWADMTRALSAALGPARHRAKSEHLVTRLRLVGTTPLAWRLRYDHDLLQTEAENQAERLGKSWIDKIEMECSSPTAGGTALSSADSVPLEDLRRLMTAVAQDQGYRDDITQFVQDFRSQLPPECRDMLGQDENAVAAFATEASMEGIEEVLARFSLIASDETT